RFLSAPIAISHPSFLHLSCAVVTQMPPDLRAADDDGRRLCPFHESTMVRSSPGVVWLSLAFFQFLLKTPRRECAACGFPNEPWDLRSCANCKAAKPADGTSCI